MENNQPNIGVRILPILMALIAGGVLAVKGCQQGPFGRTQVVALNPNQESQLGAQAFRETLQQSDVVATGPAVEAVGGIAKRLARATEAPVIHEILKVKFPKFEWAFRLVRSQQVNAFCLPGGKIVVYTGILPVAQTDTGLATVIGHEIGHALAHHGAERMAQQQFVQIGQAALNSSIDNLDPEQRRRLMGLIGAGSNLGFLLPFSRKHESEADHIGLLLMAEAGYDPAESIRFWQRMEQLGGGKTPEFMSTHPSHQRRAHDLQLWLPEAERLYAASDKQPTRRLPSP